ncbi:hypothetical protein NEIMUCOT_05129 [Neisseria mucosa ATCC 25996]|uniref:Uncharacterized protein n=1 Tax=Neisseria mucosa (strain ATCC 25996 / DSM 4631 / NCTC 10774 / M26) TaxID=546266 RepID=D2ZWY1_NEIM2|nr:hypothetical protein NEIMUCOT_05129 [Neisseria mucosa ATCC 25996]
MTNLPRRTVRNFRHNDNKKMSATCFLSRTCTVRTSAADGAFRRIVLYCLLYPYPSAHGRIVLGGVQPCGLQFKN